ncbi:hypothetical protein K438DRAFT_756232 [Mycena galopus ATCC 62051]|nr:hypothetical protein K438DRAFT_756232 [Mycena galopus ATCC 62051]
MASNISEVSKWALNIIPTLDCKFNFGGSLQKTIGHFLHQFEKEDIASLEEEEASRYLCCLLSFFRPLHPSILKEKSKREFKFFLMTQLFKELQSVAIDSTVVTRIIKTTSQLLHNGIQGYRSESGQVQNLVTEMSKFCSSLSHIDGWLDLVVSAAMLTRIQDDVGLPFYFREEVSPNSKSHTVGWIYLALEYLRNKQAESTPLTMGQNDTYSRAVEGLLTVLAWSQSALLAERPSAPIFDAIMQTLKTRNHASLCAFFVLTGAHSWFLDPNLKQIIEESAVLTQLGSMALDFRNPQETRKSYIELWYNVAQIPEWQSSLQKQLSTWITVYNAVYIWEEALCRKSSSVLRKIWVHHINDKHKFKSVYEESWALSLTALAQEWEVIDFSTLTSLDNFVRLGCGTVSLAFRVHYRDNCVLPEIPTKPISSSLRAIFSPRLGRSIAQVAENIITTAGKNEEPEDGSLCNVHDSAALTRIAEFLMELGRKIATEFEPGSGKVQLGGVTKEYDRWDGLQILFKAEIYSIERSC